MTKSTVRSNAWRSRWAAVGAAVAVTLGAGGLVAVNAAPSEPSTFVSITPTRILDTRTDVGLDGPFFSDVSQTLQVTGTVPTQPSGGATPVDAEVVPAGATAVVFNATVVRPVDDGFLSVRPGDATGIPATSNINWSQDGANVIANSITVQLSAAGQIDIYQAGPDGGISGTSISDVLLDVAGYYIDGTAGPTELPPVGAFMSQQIVKGAILTCEPGGLPNECIGPLLNGELIDSDSDASAEQICLTVFGTGVDLAIGTLVTTPTFEWNGTNWALTGTNTSINSIESCIEP